MFKRKKKETEQCTFSEARQIVDGTKPKTRFTTKLYFWLFVLLSILSAFMFWTASNTNTSNDKLSAGISTSIISGIISLCLSIFFALICFVRFLRSRSIIGGLFLTTTFSTAIFLGASQLIPIIIPPTASAFSAAPDATNNGMQLIVSLAQIGLFTVWFLFLLFTIYLYVNPIKKIDKYLQKIIDGDNVKKVRIGKAKQYRGIEEKLMFIAQNYSEEKITHKDDAHTLI